jgi:hypothetical protein
LAGTFATIAAEFGKNQSEPRGDWIVAEYAPRTLGESGKRLWKSVVDEYELSEHERVLLLEACRTADLCDRLSATAARVDRPSRVLVELRQQRATLVKLFAALGLPSGCADNNHRAGPVRHRAPSLRRTS